MQLEQFVRDAKISEMGEVDRTVHLAFFCLKISGLGTFKMADVKQWCETLHFSEPNLSRLRDKLIAARFTIYDRRAETFRLQRNAIESLEAKYPNLNTKDETVADSGTILPEIVFKGTRGYIESLARQINSSYEHNIFDGCAVLMRRLEEVLLISAYEKIGIENEIKGNDSNYVMLEAIVANATNNPRLALSRNSKKDIEVFRKMGNYSAHKVTYICRRQYIQEKIDDYRALIDELIQKAGFR